VTSAWPYVSGIPHLGNMIGSVLSADVFARYLRLKGDDLVFVSGSDCHGTPIEVEALKRGIKPEDLALEMHSKVSELFKLWEISYDNYTLTYNPHHYEFVQEFFRKIYDNGYIFTKEEELTYCPKDEKFLPDRFVEGECPYCHTPGARGDQCDACGKPLEPTQLIDPYCVICGTTPITKKTEHWYLDFPKFQEKLIDFIKNNDVIPDNARSWSLSFLEEGLKPRAITRDLAWGIPAPFPEAEEKVIYVWFEAVLGYVSATKEWAEKIIKNPEKWKDYWFDEKTRTLFFIGKDNIVFHSVMWPAMLMGYGDLILPYDVPSNEFLMIEGKKLSTSGNWAVWVPDYLERYDPDPLRYILSIIMPETSDTNFSWSEFVRRNNDELVATYGNLVNRVLTLTYRNYEGCVPQPGELNEQSRYLMKNADDTLEKVDKLLYGCHFREALRTVMSLAQETNRYLDDKAPWKVIKEDRLTAGTSLYVALSVISYLKTIMYPFLPFSSQKVHEYLGFEGDIKDSGWKHQELNPGQKLQEPKPLFKKLDTSVIDEETARLGK